MKKFISSITSPSRAADPNAVKTDVEGAENLSEVERALMEKLDNSPAVNPLDTSEDLLARADTPNRSNKESVQVQNEEEESKSSIILLFCKHDIASCELEFHS